MATNTAQPAITPEILATACDVRLGIVKFIDVPANDRPAVVRALSGLSDARMQELLGTRKRYGGFGVAQRSHVG